MIEKLKLIGIAVLFVGFQVALIAGLCPRG
jgi:hypothetical protein